MDRFLVVKSPTHTGKFIVLEGNRRILAVKLLKNQALIPTLSMPDAFRKRLLKAAHGFNVKRVEPVDCYEVADRAEGIEWISQRHNGADEGRGIVDWSSIARSRFKGRDPALQALDFVMEHGGLSDEHQELIAGKFPLTTLDRLLSTPSVRTAIGFDISNGKLNTELPPEEALKPLKRLVLDLADRKINVTQLKSKDQQNAYINTLRPADRPNLSKKTGHATAVESMTQRDFTPKQGSPSRPQRTARPSPRVTVVPKSCHLNIPVAKINGIYQELRSLQLTRHVHAISVLMRVFLEMSVDEYLEKKANSTLTFQDPNSGRILDKKLKDKVKETIDHLVANGTPATELRGIMVGMTDKLNPFSIDTLHSYIHNRFFTPTDAHLATGWDNAQRFFEKIWP
ncbi:MAG TPA: hypothetical protein VMD97_05725 [Candidatus Aquilonibacter sp.]|nr:hypothetical protein [Candidatus Aquilonibacter sp.]